jgi:hypothetical protein
MKKKKKSVGRYDLDSKDSVVGKDHPGVCTALHCIALHRVMK